MKNYKYSIKKVIIGSTMGAALLFGAAGMTRAQDSGADGINASANATAKARTKLKNPEQVSEAKSAVSVGYMEGFKYGQKDGSRNRTYNAKIQAPNEDDAPSAASLRRNYKPFYEAGFLRGYEDGFKKTTKFGAVSEAGGEKGFTVYPKVLDDLVGGTE